MSVVYTIDKLLSHRCIDMYIIRIYLYILVMHLSTNGEQACAQMKHFKRIYLSIWKCPST